MNKYICCLILCSMLLLYCCRNRNPIPEESNQSNGYNTTLTADEKLKINALKGGFDTIIKYLQNQLINNPNLETHAKNQYQEIVTKYPEFIEWLSNNIQKKKELADAFTIVYNFLNAKRKLQTNKISTEQIIINTINCHLQTLQNQFNVQCNNNDYAYNKIPDINTKFKLYVSFDHLLQIIHQQKTNEKSFKNIIDSLLEPAYPIAILIGTDGLEATVRKKLNDSQRQGLDSLKAALNNKTILHNFLISNKKK
ncbi:Mlp family lipoprotein (plasmid) [Borrelia miyamotoi]|uniref:Mlp family lipoprotein n=1 Tax=Borrelia miyamotoi TaxID=47466 RepID=A0A5P8ARW0_9SPIR|nr:Mlp family lipoprotein [Borrelia miyamotoi]QFP42618.1 Mlp family lipoprotein [Borrelia miyamotoi]WAZ72530.1 Mlp family lipoprotein [Borrelia miyamotoi]WVI05699.1 Mlp family lipoprotein [Borrelia miyamotoi]